MNNNDKMSGSATLIHVNGAALCPDPAVFAGWNSLTSAAPGVPGQERKSSAMKHARIVFGLGVLVFSATGAMAKPAYVASTVNLRAAPGTTSEIVDKIPGGSLVDAKDCSDGWCAVTWQEKSGFAIQTALDMSGRVPRRAGPPGYPPRSSFIVEDEPYYEAPPPPVYYDGPYYRRYWGWRRHW